MSALQVGRRQFLRASVAGGLANSYPHQWLIVLIHRDYRLPLTRMRMRITPASDSSLYIGFGDVTLLEAHRQVVSAFRALENLHDTRIRNLHPAYTSLLIDFDPLNLTHEEVEGMIGPEITFVKANV